MPSTVTLDLDVLRQIIWSSDRQTCAALILLCRFFYEEAAKRILHDPVIFSYHRDVWTFVRFLGPQPQARARYVRELHFSLTRLSLQAMHALEGPISHMDRLESLVIDQGDDFLDFCPSLGEALAGLTSLRRLRIYFAAELTCNFLKALQSDLVSMSLDWTYCDDSWFTEHSMADEDWAAFHPVPLLAKWHSTLEELHCENWHNTSQLPVFTDVYPNMRRLTIDFDKLPLVTPYIRAYPNLSRLSAQTNHDENIKYPEDADLIRQHRALNIASQEAVGGPGTWRCLGEYVGCFADLYLLGLTCRISRIALTTQMTDLHLELLSTVLSYAQPKHLKLEGDVSLLGHSTHSLPAILRGPASSRLESLVLKVDLETNETSLDVGAALNALASALAKRSLRRLRLRVVAKDPRPKPRLPAYFLAHESELETTQAPRTGADIKYALQELNIDAFMGGIPSLTDAIVEFRSPRRSGDRQRKIVPEHPELPGAHDPHMYEII
ncbi:hypothetical protein OH76DRAFT_511920 [Lentinus brumalis]|uniref:F-box domain-containing protein n=1 Tax=Lentinus brumalis TaxID=2498619 RepID=A0A371DB53_9APHY|nr:hypothetical protein OH76DRAFT_511920 [Polyporus brumalis]